MSTSFEKSVKGATKIKAAPPKTKYIEHILVATHVGEHGVAEVFRALQMRLRDSTWTVVFKSLITIHFMIREGKQDVTLAFLAKHRNMLAISAFTDAQTQGRNIRHYAGYLAERARAYRETKRDWARAKDSRLDTLTVDKGLLRETEIVQHQVTALLKCDVMDHDPENEITLMVFRLLVLDLLSLFQALNQGLVNLLGHFFEMSKTDAERALNIYRNFTKQMEYVVQYLDAARQYEHVTRVKVQELKHVPVHLQRQLEDYVRDPDFEINRRQYLAELEVKKKYGGSVSGASGVTKFKTDSGGGSGSGAKSSSPANGSSSLQQPVSKPQANKGPDPDLIDFFDSIEQNQTPMQAQVGTQQAQVTGIPYQQTGFQQHATIPGYPMNGVAPQATGFAGTNPFQQQAFSPAPQLLQPQFTGAGFGGFTPQPAFQPGSLGTIPQNSVATFPQVSPNGLQPMQTGAQATNPFRASMIMQQQTGTMPAQNLSMSAPTSPALQRSNTNPFARPNTATQPFTPSLATTQEAPAVAPLKPMPTGTNPFAKMSTPPPQSASPQTAQAPLVPQPTGTTNPFRQGNFVNHTTGMGWQHNQQRIGGGYDEVETIPVFPRPAQQTPWQ